MKNNRHPLLAALALAGLCAASWAAWQAYAARHEPQGHWSVAFYTGPSPFNLHPQPGAATPALTPEAFPLYPATDIADPFMIRKDNVWYLFAEVVEAKSGRGKIACAESPDGKAWRWRSVVIDEPFHLSYPYVFEWENEYYIIPESRRAGQIRLYKAESFPDRWKLAAVLAEGEYRDTSVIRHGGAWWMITAGNRDTLHLFSAPALTGPWTPCPGNPVKTDPCTGRPGGRMFEWNGKIYRFAQDRKPAYGSRTWAMEVTRLSPGGYAETLAAQRPVVEASGSGWNATGMHTVDPHEVSPGLWLSTVDGHSSKEAPPQQ